MIWKLTLDLAGVMLRPSLTLTMPVWCLQVRKAKEVRTRFDLRSWVVHLKNLKTMAEKGTLAYDAQKPLDSSGARSADGWVPLMQDKGPAMHA